MRPQRRRVRGYVPRCEATIPTLSASGERGTWRCINRAGHAEAHRADGPPVSGEFPTGTKWTVYPGVMWRP